MELISKITREDFPADVQAFLGDSSWCAASPTLVFELASKKASVRTLFDANGIQYFVAADLRGIGIDASKALQSRDSESRVQHYEKGFHWVYMMDINRGSPTGDLPNKPLHPQTQLLTKEGLIQLISRSNHPGIDVLQRYIQRWFALMSTAMDRARERATREETEAAVRRIREEAEEKLRAYEVRLERLEEENKMLSSTLKGYEIDPERRPLNLISKSPTKIYLFVAAARTDGKAPFIKVGISKQAGNTRLTQVKQEIKRKYKIECELTKLCEFDCYDADTAEKLCHKMLEPVHLEDEYFKPYLKYIIYCMKRACYIVNRECELTNEYIIPYIYTGEDMVDDLYAFMDKSKGDVPLEMDIEGTLKQAIDAFTELLGGTGGGEQEATIFDRPLAITMSEEMIEQYRKEAVEAYKKEEMDKVVQILLDEGCTVLEGCDGGKIVPRQDCIYNLGISKSHPLLKNATKHPLHDIDDSFHHSSIAYDMKEVVKATLKNGSHSTRGARVQKKMEKVLIEDPLEEDTLQ